jgi:predicted O-methyltransferase YrrM
MMDVTRAPAALRLIRTATERAGFTMACDDRAGALLAALAASKPGGRFLELGTGTGVGTAWLLSGMNATARLLSIDNDPAIQEIARRHLDDPRVAFIADDGGRYLEESTDSFDLIYADAWPGKFTHRDRALALLAVGGIYYIDDLLPQANWPDGHGSRVDDLIADLERRGDLLTIRLDWSSGLMMSVKVA